MEMSRQRIRPSLGDSTQLTCPRCKGQGTIRNVESVTLSVLRLIEEEAMKKGTERVIAHLPIDCATFLLNEKRSAIQELESRLNVTIVILPSKHIETPAYDIERIKSLEGLEDKPSHLQLKEDEITVPDFAKQTSPKFEKAAVKEFLPDAPAPVKNKKTSTSLIQRFWQRLVGKSKTGEESETANKSGDREGKPRPGRNNRRDRTPGGRNPRHNKRPANPAQTSDSDNADEVNSQITNSAPANTSEAPQRSASTADRPARRNRNRRRGPRNAGDKRQDPTTSGESSNQEGVDFNASPSNAPENTPPRTYNADFAERKQRAEVGEQLARSNDNRESPVTTTTAED
jgi:ribonuclease E